MDDWLQTLERRVASGDPGAVVQLLVAHVRCGKLSSKNVELAAYLGDRTATQACSHLHLNPSKKPNRWLRGIVKRCPTVTPRIVVVCLEMNINGHPDIPAPVGGKRPGPWSVPRDDEFFRNYVLAARSWLDEPTSENSDAMRAARDEYHHWYSDQHWWEQRNMPALLAPLDDLTGENIFKLTETNFRLACETQSPTYSKWGEQQVEQILEAQITADLVSWALKR